MIGPRVHANADIKSVSGSHSLTSYGMVGWPLPNFDIANMPTTLARLCQSLVGKKGIVKKL